MELKFWGNHYVNCLSDNEGVLCLCVVEEKNWVDYHWFRKEELYLFMIIIVIIICDSIINIFNGHDKFSFL